MASTFSVVLAAVLVISIRAQNGIFTYALDDAAIHLALARALAHHGTFGLVPGVYESASSAPVWELLLAPMLLVSNDSWWAPLVLNVAAAGLALWVFARLDLVQRLARTGWGLAAVAALPIGLGLVPLALSGMEHTLHLALVVLTLMLLVPRAERGARTVSFWPIWALVAFGTLVRFETVFVAAAIALTLALIPTGPRRRRHVLAGAITLAASLVTALGFAVVNHAFGQDALPNSVIAKTAIGQKGLPIPSPADLVAKVTQDPLLLIAIAIAVVVLVRTPAGGRVAPAKQMPLVVMLLTTGAHLLFAEIGWFERYQAYLIGGLAYGVLVALPEPAPAWKPRTAAVLVLALCVLRVPLLVNTPAATYNVYESEYQLGQFLDEHYDGAGVGVNDIGYVALMHDGQVADFVGLGSYDLLRARKEQRMSPASNAEAMARQGVEVVAVHDEFFSEVVPAGWQPVGRWCLTNRRIALASACTTFYALPGAPSEKLRTALAEFDPKLPPEVDATIL